MASKAKTKKYAVETYYRDANGKLITVLVDAATGQPVTNPKDYRVVTQEQLDAGVLGLGDLNTSDDGDTDTGADDAEVSFGSNVRIPEYGRGKRDGGFGGKGKFTRDASNNYGFRSTPTALKAAGLIPGPLGMAAKVGTLGMRVNNNAAKDALSKDMGLEEKKSGSFLDNVANLISGGDEGYAGEAKIGDKSYGVSLGNSGMASGGGVVNDRTTLTPNEAQTRRAMNPEKDKRAKTDVAKTKIDKTGNPLGVGGVKTSSISGYDRTGLSSGAVGILDALDAAGYGDIGVNSGYRDPVKNKAVGGKPKSQHLQGNAIDLDFSGLTDEQKTDALDKALAAGAGGVGISIDRNGIHLDARRDKAMWGYRRGKDVKATPKDLPAWAQGPMETWASQDNGIYSPMKTDVVPQSRPTPTPASSFRSGFSTVPNPMTAQNDDEQNIAARSSGAPTVAQGIINQAKTPMNLDKLGFNPYQASPAQLQNSGLRTARTPAEQNAINLAIAGELGPNTLKALANDDPNAIAEYANMRATIENRLAKVSDLSTVLDGSQFNSMLSKNLPNTMNNYKTYKDALDNKFAAFDAGTIKAPNPNVNSYYNPDLVTPDWTNKSFGVVGEHKFGAVSNWSKYSQDFYAERKDIANKVNKASPQGYSGAFGSFGRSDTPSSGRSVFGGGSNRPASSNYSARGGLNAPGEGSRFGGTGLGTAGMGTKQGSNFGRGDTPSSGKSSFGGSIGGSQSTGTSNMGRSDTPSSGRSSFGGGSTTDKDKDSHAARAGF